MGFSMKYKSPKLIFCAFFFYMVSLNALLMNTFLTNVPFPLAVGLIYQIAKSNEKNGSLRFYLGGGAFDLIGFRTGEYYARLPLTALMVGFCANKLGSLFSGCAKFNNFKGDLYSLCIGVGLTFAWSLIAPYRFNPFLWTKDNKNYVNQIIRLC
jgi:hypothetical protein